jgi:hypothetical protein
VTPGNFLRALQRLLRLDRHFFKSQHDFFPLNPFPDGTGPANSPAPLSQHNYLP